MRDGDRRRWEMETAIDRWGLWEIRTAGDGYPKRWGLWEMETTTDVTM